MKKSIFVFLVGCGSVEIITEKETQVAATGDEDLESPPLSMDTAEQSEDEPETELPSQPEAQDYSVSGPYSVTSTEGSFPATGCAAGMPYEHFVPEGVENPPFMVLGHGFLRSGKMLGWGEHLASWGVEVVAPELCHFNVLAGVDHEQNGVNMIELADGFGRDAVIYGGQSAGGLAAIIATAQDPNAIGLIGLDATDTEDVPSVPDFVGQLYAGSVTTPAYGLLGEPSTCNSNNNGITLYEMMDIAKVVRVTSADHCDFENPTDWLCVSLCTNEGTSFSDEEISSVIKHLGTSAALALSGDSDAEWQWDTETLTPVIESGQIEVLR